MARFLTQISDVLTLLGINLIIPRELKSLLIPRLTIKAKSSSEGKAVSYLSLENLIDFSWEVSIGDNVISREEFLRLLKSAGSLINFKNQYLLLKPDEANRILDKLNLFSWRPTQGKKGRNG